MKSKLVKGSFYSLLALVILFTACSKEGPTGPAGATGASGPAGPAGPAGAPGTKGDPGSANVYYSDWIDTVRYQGNDSTGWFAQITAPQLVDSIINKGEIKVYLNAGSDSADNQFVMPLPIVDIAVTGAYINPYFSAQTITLIATADVSSTTLRNYHYFQYRYILIPGGTKAGRYANKINWDNYDEVKKYLGLKN